MKAFETGDVVMPRKSSTKKKGDLVPKSATTIDKSQKKTATKDK
jgi:hypothetical protein